MVNFEYFDCNLAVLFPFFLSNCQNDPPPPLLAKSRVVKSRLAGSLDELNIAERHVRWKEMLSRYLMALKCLYFRHPIFPHGWLAFVKHRFKRIRMIVENKKDFFHIAI